MIYQKSNIPVKLSLGFNQSFMSGDDTYVEFLASNMDTSSGGHKMTENSIRTMKKQAIGLPVFVNHNPDAVCANITNVKATQDHEFRPIAKLFSETGDSKVDTPVKTVKNWLDNGVGVGASIGATILQMKFKEEDKNPIVEVNNLRLHEVSLTPIPAILGTAGSVRTFREGLCQSIGNQVVKGVEKMQSNEEFIHELKTKKMSIGEKRQTVQILDKELSKVRTKMSNALGLWEMQTYHELQAQERELLDVLQALDPFRESL